MPPRYAYWTILAGGLPTAFRAADRDELLPTFQRLRQKHPDAEMKWFARGKLWDSPDAARQSEGRSEPRDARGRDWRPGGDHRDPRQKFADAKAARNQQRRAAKFTRKHRPDAGVDRDARPARDRAVSGGAAPKGKGGRDWRRDVPREKPHGDKLRAHTGPARERRDWRPDQRRQSQPPPSSDRAPRERPHGDPLRAANTGRDSRGGSRRDNARPPSPQGKPRFEGDKGYRGSSQGSRPAGKGQRGWERKGEGGWRGSAGAEQRAWRNQREGRDSTPREKPHGDTLSSRDTRRDTRRDHRADVSRETPRPQERAPREKPHGDPMRASGSRQPGRTGPPAKGGRRFERPGFERNQRTEPPAPPDRPRDPNREPRRDEPSEPTPPPRPSEPAIIPPGPPERGRKQRRS